MDTGPGSVTKQIIGMDKLVRHKFIDILMCLDLERGKRDLVPLKRFSASFVCVARDYRKRENTEKWLLEL
jgi:hypothetical protein